MSLEELCGLRECLLKGRIAPETWDWICGEGCAAFAPVKWQKLGSFSFLYGGTKGEAW